MKIELVGTGDTIYFIVTAVDGSTVWYGYYGGGVPATDLTAFYISRYEDANGNFITYEYATFGNGSLDEPKLHINSIQFSSNKNGSLIPLNRIDFFYTPNGVKIENAFVKGKKLFILNEIQVKTGLPPNQIIFKKYIITHQTDDLGYKKVQQIQEFNSLNEGANPIIFEYDISSSGITSDAVGTTFTDTVNLANGIKMSGDYNGDNRMDIAFDNFLYIKSSIAETYSKVTLPYTISNRTTMTGSLIRYNTIAQYQSLINANESPNAIEFKTSIFNPNTPTYQSGSKIITFNNADFTHGIDTDEWILYQGGTGPSVACQTPSIKSSNEYFEGDFNGDGLSETLIYKTINERYYFHTKKYYAFTPIPPNIIVSQCETRYLNDGKECFIVDLNPNSSNILGQTGYL